MARALSWRDSDVVSGQLRTRPGGFRGRNPGNARRTEQRQGRSTRSSGTSREKQGGLAPDTPDKVIDELDLPDEIKNALKKGWRPKKQEGFWAQMGGAAKDALGRTFDAIDTPRAFLTALGSEAGEEAAFWLNDDKTDARMRAKGINGFSWRDVAEQTWGNQSFTEQTEADQTRFFKDRGVTYDPGTGRTSGGNWQTVGLQIAGDIASDPLSYVGGAGALDDPQKVARRLTSEGVTELGEEGAKEAAARVLRQRTASALTDRELAAIGEKGGLYFRTPGTGAVGRRVGVPFTRLKLDRLIEKAGVPTETQFISRSGKLGRAGTGANLAARKPLNWALNSRAGRTLTKAGVAGGLPLLRAQLRSGDPEKATEALWTITGSTEARGVAKALDEQWRGQAAKLLRDGKKAGVSRNDMQLALSGDAEALVRVEAKAPGLAQRSTDFFEDMRVQANRAVGDNVIARRENYMPRMLNPEFRDEILGGGRQGTKSVESVAKRRKYGTGVGDADELLGHKIIDQAEHPKGWSEERQIDEILRTEGVAKDGKGWYNLDAEEAWPTYIGVLSKQVEREYTAKFLKDRGIGSDLFREVVTDESRKAVARKMQAEKGLRAAEARARKAKRAVDEAARDIDPAVSEVERLSNQQGDLLEAADAIDEYGQTVEEARNVQMQALDEYRATVSGEREVLSSERAAAKLKLDESTRIVGELNDRMRRLLDYRDELQLKQARAWERAGERISAAETRANVKEIDAVRDEIAAIDNMLDDLMGDETELDEASQAVGARLEEVLSEGSDDMEAVRRQLDDEMDMILRRQDQIDEGREYLKNGRQEASDRLLGLQQAAAENGQDALAEQYVRLQQNLPVPVGELPALQHGGTLPEGRLQPAGASGENLFGPGLYTTDRPNIAEAYAEGKNSGRVSDIAVQQPYVRAVDFDAPPPPDVFSTFQQFAAENGIDVPLVPAERASKTYATINQALGPDADLALRDLNQRINALGYDAITHEGGHRAGIGDEFHRVYIWLDPTRVVANSTEGLVPSHGGGWTFTPKQAATQGLTGDGAASFDQFLGPQVTDVTSLDDGTLQFQWRADNPKVYTPDDSALAEGLTEALRQGLIDPDEVTGTLERVFGERADAAVEVFGYMGRSGQYNLKGLAEVFDTTPGDVVAALENGLTPSQKQLAAEALSDRLVARGHDGVLVPNGDSWTAIALDPATLKRDDGTAMLNSFWEKQQELMTLMGVSPKVEAKLDMADSAIERLGPDIRSASTQAQRNRQRLQQIESELSNFDQEVNSGAETLIAEEAALRQKVEGIRADVMAIEDQAMALDPMIEAKRQQVALLEANYLQAEADQLAAGKKLERWEDVYARLRNAKLETTVVKSALQDGYRRFGLKSMLPDEIVEALTASGRMAEPDALRGVLRVHDRVLAQLKGYMVLSPGFHWRNTFGIVFNNWLARMPEEYYDIYTRASIADGRGGLDQFAASRGNPMIADAYREARRVGVLTGGQTTGELEARVGKRLTLRPWSQDFVPLRASRAAGETIEDWGRGSLFMYEYVRNGGDTTEALQRVMKFHFDYDDLSPLERSVFRRIIPFYTWTRRSVPLMLEMIAREPAKMGRYFTVKRGVESMSEEEGVVPSYYADNYAIRLPYMSGDAQMYAMPDLPFMGLADVTDPGQLAGQVSPFIKTPYEYNAGKQVWKGIPLSSDYEPMPGAWRAIPGLERALRAIGKVEDSADGDPMMRERDSYFVGQLIPQMAQARRLFPSEDKYEDRRMSSWLSWGLGTGVRTNTESEQVSEMYSRYFTLKDEIDSLVSRGYEEDEAARKAFAA